MKDFSSSDGIITILFEVLREGDYVPPFFVGHLDSEIGSYSV